MAVRTSESTLLERVFPPALLRWVELIRNLAVRDVETRYKHSLLGLYWTLVNPLISSLIFSFVFQDIFHVPSRHIPYIVFLLTGFTFWNFFGNAVGSATSCITGNSLLLAKLYFPRLVLPTASVLARLIDFMFSLAVLLIFVWVYKVPLYTTSLWIPLVLLIQVIFTLGVAFLTSALNVLYRDMTQLIGLLLLVWMYMSPVMYHVSQVPANLQAIVLLNPMGALMEIERNLLFTGHLTHPIYLWVALVWTVFVYASGIRVFKKIEPLFSEVL